MPTRSKLGLPSWLGSGQAPIIITMMKFKHIRTRYMVIVLAAFLAIQLAGLLTIKFATDRHATVLAEEQIAIGEQLFVNLLQHNTASLKQGVQLLAADGAMADAASSQDAELIKFVLEGYQSRIHAQLAYFMSPDASQVIGTVDMGMHDLRQIILENQTGTLKFGMIEGKPYQLVTVPIKSATLQGWLVMGFALDARLGAQIRQLTHLDVTFLQKTPQHGWTLLSSTADSALSNLLVKTVADFYGQKLSPHRMEMHGQSYQIKIRSLHETKQEAVLVVLQGSITPLIADLTQLFKYFLWLTLIGAILLAGLIWLVTRKTTSAIDHLAKHTSELVAGYDVPPVQLRVNDEMVAMATALNRLQEVSLQRSQSSQQLAFDDALTGLSNRLSLQQALQQAVALHADTQQKMGLVLVNLQRFKQINQTFGRDFGDAVLRQVGQLFKQHLPGDHDMVARLDADQFAVLLQQADQAKTTRYADKIQQLFEQPVTVQGQVIEVSAAIGIALYPEHGTDEATLLRHADTALQAAVSKKSPWIVYNTALEIDQAETLALTDDLKQAIEHNQFLLYIQPKIDLTSRRVLGGEALIRWVHPERGMLLPDQFIPVAEQTGIINEITHWMLLRACQVLAEFQKQGLRSILSVNLSARDLHNIDLPEQIAHLLSAHELQASALKLEVTERSLMQDPERAESALRKLAALGLHIAIDDFGTGYSALRQLAQLQVKEVKVDRSFVMFMDKHASDASIVKSTIDLAHNLGLNVVAEGIESEQVLNQLIRLGCHEGQGFFIGKPMPEKDFSIWLERWEGQNEIQIDVNIGDELSYDVDPLDNDPQSQDPFKLDNLS